MSRLNQLLLAAATFACAQPLEPTPACVSYVACQQARDSLLGINTDMVRFQTGGACWGNPEISDLCDRGCASGIAWLRTAEPSLPAAFAP